MDIDKLYTVDIHEKGAEMRVKDQFGENTDIYIRFVGQDSKTWRKIQRDADRKLIGLDYNQIQETKDNMIADMVAGAAISWRGAALKGKQVKFSVTAIRKFLKSAPYIVDQADKFIGGRANFMQS